MNKLEKKYKDRIINYRLRLFLFGVMCLFFFGSTCNHLVIVTNNFKMPVYTYHNVTEWDNNYFNYIDDKNINNPFLADNIYLYRSWWSIGDFFMIISISILISYLIFTLIYLNYLIVRRMLT